MTAVLLTAFAAGLVATVNPCGFAMLPAYLSWFLGLDDETARVGRALRVGTAVGSGFLVVFGVVGALLVVGLRVIIDVVPWAALLVGVALIAYGIATWTGRKGSIPLPRFGARGRDRSDRSAFLFGVSYAVASLSCTMPIFLSLVVAGFTRSGPVVGVLAFAAYGLGTATLLLALTVSLAVGREGLVRRIRGMSAHLDRIAGGLLVAGGAFVVWYWGTILTVGPEGLGGAGRVVDALSRSVTRLVGAAPVLTALVTVVVIGLPILRRRGQAASDVHVVAGAERPGRSEDDLLP